MGNLAYEKFYEWQAKLNSRKEFRSNNALVWSNSQQAFKVEPIEKTVTVGLYYYFHNRSDFTMDYIVVFIGTDMECHRMADALELLPKPKKKPQKKQAKEQ